MRAPPEAVCGATPLPAAEYYAGKTIDLLIGGNVGGGYDIYARVVSRHLGRFIPGHPTIVAKNLPGAGSARAPQMHIPELDETKQLQVRSRQPPPLRSSAYRFPGTTR